MYLKQIEMQGFKSFPDRTKLTFEPGATVIVGPNGSGKSNISDAMRWVLGEISSKSLRGSKMEDIIFGGADSRKPMGYAEVSVTFDNTPEKGHIDCPYDEITVTRRYYRNGNSEYFINRKDVLLRDIYELFLNTGIGRDGYSIIGQGRIAEIISRKSDERRDIFEDAAGIAKYRHRKNEAERKLAATQSNMERAQDLIDEIGSRLAPLERDSIKAKRFVEYSEIKRQADVQLWLFDTERLRGDITRAEAELKRTEIDLGEMTEAVETLEAQADRLEELITGGKLESERLLVAIREKTKDNYQLDSEIKVTETRIAHAEEALLANRRGADAQRAAAAAERASAAAKLDEAKKLNAEVASLVGEEAALRTAGDDTAKAADRLDAAVAAAFGEISECRAELSDVNARAELLGRSNDEGQDRDEAARRDITERGRIAAQHAAECSDSEYTIAQYDAKIASNSAALEKKRAEAERLQAQYDRLSDEISGLTVKCNTLTQNIENLRRMEELFDGYNNSVRHIMRAYRDGRVTGRGGKLCGQIYGPLSKLIGVDSRYVTAIETALGAGIQNIVVEDEETAHAAIECLKRDGAGRATFCPVTSVRGPGAPGRELLDAARFTGYIGTASSLVAADERFSGIISSMLGRVAVFDTLENATAMAKSAKYGIRIVTLDGQQINRDGSFTGGSVKTSSGILTRADDIKRLTGELEAAKLSGSAAVKEQKARRERLDALNENIALDEDEAKLLGTLRAVEAAKLEKQRETLESDNALLERFRADLESVAGEKEKRQHEIETLTARAAELNEKITALEAYRADCEAQRGELLIRHDEQAGKTVKITVRISELRRDIESCNAMAERFRTNADTLFRDAEDKQRLSDEAAGDVTSLRGRLAQIIADHASGEAELEKLNASRRDAENSGFELEKKKNETERVRKEREARVNELTVIRERGSMALSQLRTQLDGISQQLWDDYQFTREKALEFGYPAITAAERAAVIAVQTEYRNKIRNIGTVNVKAIEEYQTEKARHDELSAQMADLTSAKNELEKVIAKLETEMKRTFAESFDQINRNFGRTFSELFGGGSAQLLLTDPDNVLESGIEIKAAPPGKIIKSLMQLSGGEQSFVAIALFFAILQVNPTPFCILDEIEAALDEVNVERFSQYIRRYSDDTQFILITHRRGTMNAADRLYGVTMPEYGISKVFVLNVADIANKKGDIWDDLS